MKIQEPCFWYIDQEIPEHERKMQACCVECQKSTNIKGWYWAGDEIGYGDYDLECSFCKKSLHKREDK
jgi:hypothetical protein